jgi:signal transduction histidine kinase
MPTVQPFSTVNAERSSDEIDREVLRLVFKSRSFVVLLQTSLIAYIASSALPVAVTAGWAAFALAMLGLRLLVFGRLAASTSTPAARQLRIALAFGVAGGLVDASCIAVFPHLAEASRAYISMILGGMCAGVVASCSGHRRLLLSYCLPVLGTLVAAWAFLPSAPGGSALVDRAVALLIFAYLMILLDLGKRAYATLTESHAIRLRERDANERLNAALAKAQEANNAKTRFLAAASHDLRQPLHTISMLATTLALRPLDSRSGEIVSLLNTVNESLTSQLDALLDISKLDAGVVEVELRSVNLALLLQGLFAETEGRARAKGLQAAFHGDCAVPLMVHTDPHLLSRVVRNLIDNAIKFTEHGDVTLSVERQGSAVEIQVGDSGPGIALDQQEVVFQEFYQIGNPERDRSQGLGLGLSIVNRLVQLLAIDMSMISRPGAGTRFVLRLPAATSAALLAPAVSEPPKVRPFDLLVLVVDDEKMVRTGICFLLEELGCRCREASDTAEAEAAVRTARPDLVLADFRLRGEDSGIATIAAVRRRWPGVHAVLVSGDTAPDRLREAAAAGIALLHKPLSLQALRTELERAVG